MFRVWALRAFVLMALGLRDAPETAHSSTPMHTVAHTHTQTHTHTHTDRDTHTHTLTPACLNRAASTIHYMTANKRSCWLCST